MATAAAVYETAGAEVLTTADEVSATVEEELEGAVKLATTALKLAELDSDPEPPTGKSIHGSYI